MSLFDNIPFEIHAYRQWVCWRYEQVPGRVKPSKVPYNPRTGQRASVTDPVAWASFDDAISAVCNYDGIGFVFTNNDPFTGIDLDVDSEITRNVYNQFVSYSERSPSGKGCHIIVRGSVPTSVKRDGVEVYSTKRYFTMTGNVCKDRDLPIVDCQVLLSSLWIELPGRGAIASTESRDAAQRKSDREVYDACFVANNDKFLALWKGDWRSLGYYPSQSEADFALINMLAPRSGNRAQIARLFRQSGLGRREKAQRDGYVYGMINKALSDCRSRLPPEMPGLRESIERLLPPFPGNALPDELKHLARKSRGRMR
jgi:primase-polymerase (primpol)-like protein